MKDIFGSGFLLTGLFFFSSVLHAQDANFDSLKHELSIAKEDTVKFRFLSALANAYTFSYPDTAMNYAQQQLLLAKKLKSEKLEGIALHRNGVVLSTMGNYPQSLAYLLQAARIAEKIKNDTLTYQVHFGLSLTYRDQGDFKQAIHHAGEALAIAERRNLSYAKMSSSANIGSIYDKFDFPDSALFYAQKAYDLEAQLRGKHNWALIPYTLGNVYAEKRDFSTALKFYRAGLPYARNKDLMDINNALAKVYRDLGQRDSGIFYAKKNIQADNKTANPLAILEASTLLAQLYKSFHQKDSAIKYMELAAATRDSLFNREKVIQVQNIAFNEQLRRQEAEAAKTAYQNRLKMYILSGSLAVFLLIALMLWHNNWQKQKANALLQGQKAKTEQQKIKAEQALEELKTTQAQLVQREKMASLGELTAGIAHEIQNPLNFVNNFSDVNNDLLEEMQEHIDKGNIKEVKALATGVMENNTRIQHHGHRADTIVKSMMEHSRSAKGEKQLTDINALTEEYLRLAYHGVRAKEKGFNAVLETHYDATIGKINAVPQEIGRVLLNVFNNAFYAVEQKKRILNGSFTPTISVHTRKVGNRVEIRVKDNGTGMTQKVQEKIFQPFFTTKPTGEGTGLGLSLSYDIITKGHGGDLNVITEDGEYTEFVIVLPNT